MDTDSCDLQKRTSTKASRVSNCMWNAKVLDIRKLLRASTLTFQWREKLTSMERVSPYWHLNHLVLAKQGGVVWLMLFGIDCLVSEFSTAAKYLFRSAPLRLACIVQIFDQARSPLSNDILCRDLILLANIQDILHPPLYPWQYFGVFPSHETSLTMDGRMVSPDPERVRLLFICTSRMIREVISPPHINGSAASSLRHFRLPWGIC